VLARDQHFLAVKCGKTEVVLSHGVKIEFGLVDSYGWGRPIQHNGRDCIIEDEHVYISLHNKGRSTVFVSIFDVNVNGQTALLSTSWLMGIKLAPNHDYTVGLSLFDWTLRGLRVFWPKKVPKEKPIEEYVVFVLSSSAVELRHLENRRSFLPEIRGIVSGLESLTYQLAQANCGNIEADAQGKCIRYDIRHIRFLLCPLKS
jgi:hypothetical protein